MRRITILALAGGLAVLGAAKPDPDAARLSAFFCPECWVYLEGPGATDMKGNCGACGKYPVEVEAQRMEWFWCARNTAWRRAPCAENWMKRCCTGEESLAAVVPPGPGVLDAWYCPSHQAFYVYQVPILMQMRCRICARPAVKVNAQERAWFWCEMDGVWNPSACAMNPLRKCCVKREGLLLVKPETGPIAK